MANARITFPNGDCVTNHSPSSPASRAVAREALRQPDERCVHMDCNARHHREPIPRSPRGILPGVFARGMNAAHTRGNKIPAKSAQTAPSHCDHHMFTNSRVPTPRWKREEIPDALASPRSCKGAGRRWPGLPTPVSAAAARPRPEQGTRQRDCGAVDGTLPSPAPAAGAAIAAVFRIFNDSPTGRRPLMLHWTKLSYEDIILLGGTGPRHPGAQGRRPLLVRPDLGLTGARRRNFPTFIRVGDRVGLESRTTLPRAA
jgi:hypothetical protein